MGPADPGAHIALLVQINDWSLRKLAPAEMKTGFGWLHAKPKCSVAPVAITPDELDKAWRDSRVDLPLQVEWNGNLFGRPSGYHMSFGMDELLAHAAYSRSLPAGTLIGTGTVSNDTFREVGSACIAERRGIEILDHGAPQTPFMSFGDRVRMECAGPDGEPVFGAIDQRVIAARSWKPAASGRLGGNLQGIGAHPRARPAGRRDRRQSLLGRPPYNPALAER